MAYGGWRIGNGLRGGKYLCWNGLGHGLSVCLPPCLPLVLACACLLQKRTEHGILSIAPKIGPTMGRGPKDPEKKEQNKKKTVRSQIDIRREGTERARGKQRKRARKRMRNEWKGEGEGRRMKEWKSGIVEEERGESKDSQGKEKGRAPILDSLSAVFLVLSLRLPSFASSRLNSHCNTATLHCIAHARCTLRTHRFRIQINKENQQMDTKTQTDASTDTATQLESEPKESHKTTWHTHMQSSISSKHSELDDAASQKVVERRRRW